MFLPQYPGVRNFSMARGCYIYIIPLGKCGTNAFTLKVQKKTGDLIGSKCINVIQFLCFWMWKFSPLSNGLVQKSQLPPEFCLIMQFSPMFSMAMLGVVPYFQTHSQWDHQQTRLPGHQDVNLVGGQRCPMDSDCGPAKKKEARDGSSIFEFKDSTLQCHQTWQVGNSGTKWRF